MTKIVMEELKKMTADVVGDKKFSKAMTSYVEEEKRDLLSVTVFNGKAYFNASPKVAKIMEEHPDVMEALTDIFEKNLLDDDEKLEKPELKVAESIALPLLFAPFKEKKMGWTKENVSEQLTLYLNILGYGVGGDKSLVKTKFKTANKPVWFPASVDFDSYTHPSHGKLHENEDIIESILKHFGLDPLKHAKKGEMVLKQTKRSNRLGESMLEDPVIIGGGRDKDFDHDSVDFETFVTKIKRKSEEPTGSKRKSLEERVTLKKKVPPKPLEKSKYEKVRDQIVMDREEAWEEEAKRLGL